MSENQQNILEQLIKVEISDRKMKAFITVKEPDFEKRQSITLGDLQHALEKAGVKYGIKEETLQKIIGEKKWGEKILIAVGQEPVPGEDAKLELFFPTEKSLKPQVTEDGRIDYKETSLVNSVVKDTLLVRKTALTLGTKGIDVSGNGIPAANGKDINLALGQGVYKDNDDNLLIKASVDGIIMYNPRKGSLEVQQLYVISGKVDYSTGNVHVKSSVEVRGDVESGFSITTPYNVEVKGVVEVANISCEGILKVKDGIKGNDTGIIKVGGDLHSGYINNQHIKCGGSVYVANEIRNSVIECNEEVMMTKPAGVILGGKITAAKKVTAPVIGNVYSLPTEIEVGIIPKYKEVFLAKDKVRAIIQKKFEDLQRRISFIVQHTSGGAEDPRLAGYKTQWIEASTQLETLNKETKELEDAYMNVENPGVYVSKTIYPGVTIRIKHVLYEVKEEMTRVMFKLVEEEIVSSPYR